jgi:hypothetical protein
MVKTGLIKPTIQRMGDIRMIDTLVAYGLVFMLPAAVCVAAVCITDWKSNTDRDDKL